MGGTSVIRIKESADRLIPINPTRTADHHDGLESERFGRWQHVNQRPLLLAVTWARLGAAAYPWLAALFNFTRGVH